MTGVDLTDADFLAAMGAGWWASMRLAQHLRLDLDVTRRTLRRLKRRGHLEASGQLWQRRRAGAAT